MNVDSSAVLGGVAAKICIVDDDASMLRALERLLLSVGLQARLFREPLGFLEYATLNPVTVALIDIWIPGLSGLQVQKKLRAVSPETRVIVVTADDEDSVRSAAMQNGATAFFPKPFDDEIFLDAIHQAMASARAILGRSECITGDCTQVQYSSHSRPVSNERRRESPMHFCETGEHPANVNEPANDITRAKA